MRLLLACDVFPPVRTSGAVMMRDLARTFAHMGHETSVITPDAGIEGDIEVKSEDGVTVVRVKSGQLKRVNLVRRAVNEILLSYRLWRGYKKSSLIGDTCDAVLFYSPTIFLGAFVARVKAHHRCPSYLILRDIFPAWAVDLGVMRKGPHYWFFRAVAEYQYVVADTIAVESENNRKYFHSRPEKVEVLHNWVEVNEERGGTAELPAALSGKTILVYAGNMGVAQDMNNLLRLAKSLRNRTDCAILFVGDGTERKRMEAAVSEEQLENVAFYPEIDQQQLRALLQHCHVGLISLDKRLRTNNIPGKLLSYVEAGLPVLASVNPGNDLKNLVEGAKAGFVVWNGDDDGFLRATTAVLDDRKGREAMSGAARRLCETQFSASSAASQIIDRVERGR